MSERSTSPSIIERRAFDLARSANFRSWLTENKPFRTIPTATAPDRSIVGVAVMNLCTRSIVAAGIVAAAFQSTPPSAGVADMLVAPTRLVPDPGKGAQINLNHIVD